MTAANSATARAVSATASLCARAVVAGGADQAFGQIEHDEERHPL